MPRISIDKVSKSGKVSKPLPFIPSGSTLLDLVLGGGWAEGRIANIVGDKSSGKTLLAIEACANFARLHSPEQVAYREIEAAFDQEYAQSIGMPRGINYSEDVHTIEDFERDLMKWLEKQSGPNLYILDSLDAASSEAEMERETGEASYGQEKAKALSQMFRKIVKDIRNKQCTLFIISQIRDNIGARFGETKKRSGGHALDFYASQVIWLAEIAKIKRTITKVERVTGVKVLANNKKNKIGIPFRRAGMTISFGYGVDDEISMHDWLKENKGEELLPRSLAEYPKLIWSARAAKDRVSFDGLHQELRMAVLARWEEIEEALRPPMKKYT
jgi:recombination protein RecA